MKRGPGAAGLLWLWVTVAELGPGDPPEPPVHPRSIVITTPVILKAFSVARLSSLQDHGWAR